MVKFLKHHKELFPDTIQFYERVLPDILNQDKIRGPFLKYSRLSSQRAKAVVSTNTEGPVVIFDDLGQMNGLFVERTPQIIRLHEDSMRNSPEDLNESAVTDFLLAKFFHETIHWAQHPNHDSDDPGENFEVAAFGRHLDRFWSGSRKIGDAIKPMEVDMSSDPTSGVTNQDGFSNDDLRASLPRGIRNNNPGNLKRGTQWDGLAGDSEMKPFQRDEDVFCVFVTPHKGIRAAGLLLRNYGRVHGLHTITQVIDRWAPESDGNNTRRYIAHVCDVVGAGEHDPIDLEDTDLLVRLLKAIIKHENGLQPYSDHQIMQAVEATAARS